VLGKCFFGLFTNKEIPNLNRTYIGLATRICIELGFHRRVSPTMKGGLETEMRRRIFWSCYCLDRQVSIILGRPFAISDRDIDADVSLP
jgi:hypothetical protein